MKTADTLIPVGESTIGIPDLTSELVVEIRADIDYSKYYGTRVQLEEEGVIPKGTEWPSGYDDCRWQSGKFNFRLRRERPPGAKGPRRHFAAVDWFSVKWEPTNPSSYAQREIALKTQELKDALYRRTPKGEAEWSALCDRYCETTKDAAFQAFKATIPGLVPPRRGRNAKPKSCLPAQI